VIALVQPTATIQGQQHRLKLGIQRELGTALGEPLPARTRSRAASCPMLEPRTSTTWSHSQQPGQ